ncbi:SGNH/GDSL hydrolase family protein [uncultured Helicobacter sp.]|uniref:SGNH/GDSL hydrolase family protein n=1 Tax=uncultured Helicobacter sp. TaxID=175537 RepID=UPI00374E2E33
MKIFKHKIFWALLGIVFMPVVLKLEGVMQRIFGIEIVPFAWIGLYWFVFCVVLSIQAAKDSKKKLIYAYVSVLPLCLSIGEVFLYTQSQKDVVAPDEILGFAHKPNASIHRIFRVDDEIVYDIQLNTDENGLRVTTDTNKNYQKCIHFYGGSFTAGNGLNDSQTLPSSLARVLDSRDISIMNYGISAAGVHTMLARLEFDRDSSIWEQCRENVSFYIAIPHHIYRTFGVAGGPKYKLENGKAVYKGKISLEEKRKLERQNSVLEHTPLFTITERLSNQFQKSYIYKIFFNEYARSASLLAIPQYHNGYFSNPDLLHLNATTDLDLYFTILTRSYELLAQKYNSELIVILWDNDMHAEFLDKYDEAIKTFLRDKHIRFYTLSEIIPDYPKDLERVKAGDFEHFAYRISRWDTHPNALANELIAKFLADKIDSGEITTRPTHATSAQEVRDVE